MPTSGGISQRNSAHFLIQVDFCGPIGNHWNKGDRTNGSFTQPMLDGVEFQFESSSRHWLGVAVLKSITLADVHLWTYGWIQ